MDPSCKPPRVDPAPERAAADIRDHRSTLYSQAIRVACKAVSVVVLARLLTPTDHGLFAMAASVTVFLLLFRDAGFGTAAVQASALSATQLATLGWIHVGLGGLLTLLTLALAPLAIWFYQTPQVGPLLTTMSCSFLIMGAGGFIRSQLARELRFSELNRLETTAAVVGTGAMIGAGMAGAGAYSFAVFLLVSELATTVLAWRTWRWRPEAVFDLSSVRPLFRTSFELTIYHVLSHITAQVDTFAVGQAFGPRTLGLYNRSALLLALPHQHGAVPLTNVALATLARLGVAAPQFREQACRRVNFVAFLTLPPAAVCLALPGEVLRFVLGEQWPGAAPILRWLAVSSAIMGVTILAYGINVAAGRTRQLVWTAAGTLPCTFVAILLALPHGAVAVAGSLALLNLILAGPRLYWTLRGTPVALGDYCGALASPVLASAMLGAGAWCGAELAGDAAWPLRLCAAALGGVIATSLLVAAWPGLREDLRFVRAHLAHEQIALPAIPPSTP